jgi:hypothetical protein
MFNGKDQGKKSRETISLVPSRGGKASRLCPFTCEGRKLGVAAERVGTVDGLLCWQLV